MSTPNVETMLKDILVQLSSLTSRVEAFESRHPSPPSSPSGNVQVPSIVALPPANDLPGASTHHSGGVPFQHGIIASSLWRDEGFILSRDPLKNGFRLEDPKDYSSWCFSTLKLLEREGLSPFVLGQIPQTGGLSLGSGRFRESLASKYVVGI